MSSTIKLPSGKLIDLSHFVALLPDEEKTENYYKLSLAGLDKAQGNCSYFVSNVLDKTASIIVSITKFSSQR